MMIQVWMSVTQKFKFIEEYAKWIRLNESRINTVANHLIVVFAFSVPVLVSVRRLSISLLILLFLMRGRILHHILNALKDPLLASLIIYFLMHLLWLAGTDDMLSAKKSVHDAAFLLFTPVFASFIDRRYVTRIFVAFILGMSASVLVSYGIFFEVVPAMPHDATHGTPSDPTPLFHHTHYGYMLAITAVILLYKYICMQKYDSKKLLTAMLFILVVLDMFIIEGRSGYVIFAVLTFLLMLLHYKKRAVIPVLLSVVLMIVSSIAAYSYIDVFKERVDLTVKSTRSVLTEQNYNTSIGGRVGMAVYSWKVVKRNIVFGNGTGDHVSEVRKEVEKENRALSRYVKQLTHMHNEYISSLAQFGLLGLIAFLNIPFQMMRYSAGHGGVVLKLLGVSILLYSLIDIFTIGLGMLLTVVTLASVNLKSYNNTVSSFESAGVRQLVMYMLIVLSFYLIKLVLP